MVSIFNKKKIKEQEDEEFYVNEDEIEEDYIDSDFDIDENENNNEASNDENDECLEKKGPKKKNAYSEPKVIDFMNQSFPK